MVPDPTPIVFPAMSLAPLTFQSSDRRASNVTLSRRYVAKSNFSLRSSVTVTLEMNASTSPESTLTKFCAQSAERRSTRNPRISATR
ncbi:Uncharacterised protein [Mycobacteroides abscessus subsp. abscessus]|nr:Uncharacterised protein [Mycobacteroides abscessus subsp. abscessus]